MRHGITSITLASAGIALMITGCGLKGVKTPVPTQERGISGRIANNGKIFSNDDGLKLFGGSSRDENALPVNKYLWRGALSTLGQSLPLVSTDPFSGVIATDWGASPDAPNERVRVTAYVEGRELTARALTVEVFREQLNPSGAWIAVQTAPATKERIKDSILLRARELRIQDVDGPKV